MYAPYVGEKGDLLMSVNYTKLWHILVDLKITKEEFRKMAGISTSSLSKLTKGELLTKKVLQKICDSLKCDIADIMSVEE